MTKEQEALGLVLTIARRLGEDYEEMRFALVEYDKVVSGNIHVAGSEECNRSQQRSSDGARVVVMLTGHQEVIETTCESCGVAMGIVDYADPINAPPVILCPPCGGGCTCVWFRERK